MPWPFSPRAPRPRRASASKGCPGAATPRPTIATITDAGLQLDAESPEAGGDLVFLGPDGISMRAMLANGRLVSFHTIIPVPNGNTQPVFQSMRTDLQARYGEPVQDDADYVEWEDGETGLALATDVDSGGAYVSLLHMGPGYREEYRRRGLAEGTLYPPLEPRWTTIEANTTSRTAWDRTTAAGQGSGVRRVWLRTDYADLVDGPARHNVVLMQLDFDCPGRRLRAVSAVYRLDEEVVERYNPAEPDPWRPGEPESAGERLLAAVCRGR